MFKKIMLATALVAVLVTGASANQFVETYDSGAGPWSNLPYAGVVSPTGGNPGAYFSMVSSFGPFRGNPRTFASAFAAQWHGDYRGAQVTSVGFDVIVLGASAAYDMPGSIFLYSNCGTTDTVDDQILYYATDKIPQPGDGWISMNAPINCSSATIPAGWAFADPTTGNPPPVYNWDAAIQNVTMVGYYFGVSGTATYARVTNCGIDNCRLTYTNAPVDTKMSSWGDVKSLFR